MRQTLLIIVAVCAAFGGFALVVVLLHVVRWCQSRNAAPLPPIQPLAHHREHQLARFDSTHHRYQSTFLAIPPIPSSQHFHFEYPSPPGSRTRLLPSSSTSDGVQEPLTPSNPASSSNLNLTDSSPPPSSFSKQRPRRSRDDTSSLSRHNSHRRLPHSPHSQVQVILPAPLGSGITPASASRTSLHSERDLPTDRASLVDRWVSTGRDSIPSAPPSAPLRRASSNPTSAQGQVHVARQYINHRPYPSVPNVGQTPPIPPVPRVPSIYGHLAGIEVVQGPDVRALERNRK